MSAQDGLGCAISSALFLAALILLPKRYRTRINDSRFNN